MAASKEPADILAYFLRSEITEPTRPVSIGQRITTAAAYTPTGNGVTTTYTVPSTPLSCVDAVTVATVAQTEWVDYTVDIEAHQVIFTTAPANGAAISITYKYVASGASNWVYGDEPRNDLEKESYPRIGVTTLDEPEIQKQGMGETDTYDGVLIQIDVLTYRNMVCTYGGVALEGHDLAAAIARSIRNELRRTFEARLAAKLFKPVILSKRSAPFEEDHNTYRHIIELRLEAFNIGE